MVFNNDFARTVIVRLSLELKHYIERTKDSFLETVKILKIAKTNLETVYLILCSHPKIIDPLLALALAPTLTITLTPTPPQGDNCNEPVREAHRARAGQSCALTLFGSWLGS